MPGRSPCTRRRSIPARSSPSQRVELVGSAPGALADPLRVRQVVRNLLTNAGRYGGSEVWIEFGTRGNLVVIQVCDNGPGIADSEHQRIFEPYASAHPRTGMPAAVGLGLSDARQLARLMGGDVQYVPGPHTTFELTLVSAPSRVLQPAPVA